jgi:hypothetical protein
MSKLFLALGCVLVGALAGFAVGYVLWEEENARLSSELAELTLRYRQAEARLQTPRTPLKRGEAVRLEASKPREERPQRHRLAPQAPASAGAEEASAADRRPGTPAPRRGPPRAEAP